MKKKIKTKNLHKPIELKFFIEGKLTSTTKHWEDIGKTLHCLIKQSLNNRSIDPLSTVNITVTVDTIKNE